MHRRTVVGLLVGTAALWGEPSRSDARKKGKKKKCPTCATCATCPAPTVCPPPPLAPDTCPDRTCCQCVAPSPTPGCHFAPPTSSGTEAVFFCRQVCGGEPAAVVDVRGSNPAAGFAVGCGFDGTCATLRCPLI